MTANIIYDPDGRPILNDPFALAMIAGLQRHKCLGTAKLHAEGIAHFVSRAGERGDSNLCVLIANVDTAMGAMLAEHLMPGSDWDSIRARGQVPFARGLVTADGMRETITKVGNLEESSRIREGELFLCVMDHDYLAVFSLAELREHGLLP